MAEWAGVAAVDREEVAAGRVAEVDIRAAVAVAVVPAEDNVIPKNHAPTARKFLSGFLERPVGVSLKSLKKNPWAKFIPVLSRSYEPSTAWGIPPTKTAQPPAIITSHWR